MSKQTIRADGAEGTSHPRNVAKQSLTVNDLSTPATIDTKHSIFGEEIVAEACRRQIYPFLSLAEEVHAATSGIESLVGLIRRHMVDPDSDDPKLSEYDKDNLLALVQFAAKSLHFQCSQLEQWAGKHFVNRGAE